MLHSLLVQTVVVVETTDSVGIGALHPAEAAYVQGAVEKRRREFAGGRFCARKALSQLGIDNFPLLPDADRVPIWPPGVVGSISHCAGFCGAAVARRETTIGLGVDVESADPLARNLVPMVCTKLESERLTLLPRPAGAADWHKLVFSAKESVYKAYYPLARTSLDFHDVDVVIEPGRGVFTAALVRRDIPAAAGSRTFHGRYAFSTDHVYTAVALSPEECGSGPSLRRSPLRSQKL